MQYGDRATLFMATPPGHRNAPTQAQPNAAVAGGKSTNDVNLMGGSGKKAVGGRSDIQ